MPTYTYCCSKCSETLDQFHAMSASPKVKCPKCGAACKKMLGCGAGIIFKGSGFYETDYKKSGGKTTGSTGTKSESKSESGSDSKSQSKSESKPEPKSEAKSAKTTTN